MEAKIQAVNKADCTLMWVKSHLEVEGYQPADSRAKIRAYSGRVAERPSILTTAGISQDHRMYSKPLHLKWTRNQLKGLTYIVTDCGPIKRGPWVIKRADTTFCPCGEIQNAVHLTGCRLVADEKGRSPEKVGQVKEWCQGVVLFLT